MRRLAVFFISLWLSLAVARAAFDPAKDGFAFSNETFFAYGNLHHDASDRSIKSGIPYSRRCFVLCRGTLQFYQFVEFLPHAKRLSDEEYERLIRRIARIPVSQKEGNPRIALPGFANLQEFSTAYPRLLQENLGTWWPTYFRFGNWRMIFPFPRWGQQKLADALVKKLDSGKLATVYITRFKPLNHCLVLYGYKRTKTGLDFAIYDPNLPGKICHLTFDFGSRSFYYQRTWYYPGGLVNALEVYQTRWL